MLVTRKFWWPEPGQPFEFTDEELDAAEIDNSFYGANAMKAAFMLLNQLRGRGLNQPASPWWRFAVKAFEWP